ncbi:hypothetical protein NGM99_04550 [Mesorhizobium sp. RP14(2022)]|uniref:Uncharacterized protein n=1 Tax=Mesorhizobium liriopis TaxID=2953882 RepID=A0ABT1C2L3_9HYPH|nr:hypothetical protein [Mesorhizobium liriopis]MCO6049060.1 hypothetical protein [Mesorhizobium liriopis]
MGERAARHYDLGEPPLQSYSSLVARTRETIAALELLIAYSHDGSDDPE